MRSLRLPRRVQANPTRNCKTSRGCWPLGCRNGMIFIRWHRLARPVRWKSVDATGREAWTSGDDAARSRASRKNPERVRVLRLLAPDPWLLELFYMKCRAKKVVDANPGLYPDNGLSPERQYT